VAYNRPDPHNTDEFGQVLHFRRRPGKHLVPGAGVQPGTAETEPADDLAQYEQDLEEPIDYRHRMLMNVIAIAIVTFLVSAGVWIADTIAGMEKDQDCVMQGRGNCAPVDVPVSKQR
jgi:hypothetical protein